MKLYMTPGSCSTGIHILLEELELPFVRDDGAALTKFGAIAYWWARAYPKARLMPGDVKGDSLVIETMDFVVGTIHGQGFTRIFTTTNFTPHEADHPAVEARGRDIVAKAFAVMDQQLKAGEYVAGGFSIADAALFYVEFWADKTRIELPPNCLAHYQRMLTRPAVQQVLREEGYR
ncbi:MAG: glutathione binding-like protein [Gammaproteobacteria bacterium]